MEEAAEPKPVQLSLSERRHCSPAGQVSRACHKPTWWQWTEPSEQIILTCTEVMRGWFLMGLKMSLSGSFLRRVHSASPWVSFPTGPLQLHSAELSCLPPGRHLLLVPHTGISHPASQHLGISMLEQKSYSQAGEGLPLLLCYCFNRAY